MSQESGSRYDSTREAWETIWQQASVARELETMESLRSKQTVQTYTAYFSKDDLLLEAGSGLSAVVITLRKMGYNIVGLDYAVNALNISHEYDSTLPLVAGDVHKLPFGTNSLGAYLSFGVLEHFEHGMGQALDEAYRVLKPGGVLVLTIPYPNVVHRLVRLKRRLQGDSLLNDDEFYESTYTRRELEKNALASGFKIVESIPTSHAYTLWGLGGIFRDPGYYRASALADRVGGWLRVVLPWAFNYSTMLIARK